MTANVQQQTGIIDVLAQRWEQVSQKVADLAETIPENQFDARPVPGIRSFSEVLRHLAFWNRYVADTLSGKKADGTGNELPAAMYRTRESILEALRNRSADVAAVLRTHHGPLDVKATGLVMSSSEHIAEHYGQLVVYTRLMGIVPPASRT